MRNPFRRKAAGYVTGSADVVQALNLGWTPVPVLGGGSRQRIMEAYNSAKSANYAWIYANSPAVRTVVDTLVRNVGQLDLRLYEEVSESERKSKPDHPAALSLRYPNETTSSDAFVRQILKDFLLFDDAYALLTPSTNNTLVLNWIPTQYMQIRGQTLFDADVYRFWRPEGWGYIDYLPEQIMHWHGENPLDPRTGLSRLDTLRDVIAEDAALQQATIELAQSGLQEPTWVFRPADAPEWSNPARRGFEEDLNNRLRGSNSKPVVLEEGMEMRSFGVSPRDAQMYEIRRWATSQVALAFGVPLGMVGLDPNVAAAQASFYSDTLPPLCEEMTKMLNQRVLVRAYNWTAGCFEFNLDEKLMGNERLTALTSATGRPVMLTNEARAKLNLPPVKDGNELVTPQNVTVGNNPKPSPQVMPIQDPNKPPQDGSYRLPPPSKALDPADNVIDDVRVVLERLFSRQQRALANGKHFTAGRFVRELDADLAMVTPSINREATKTAAFGIHEALVRSLGQGNRVDVFELAHKSAGRIAQVLVTQLGMDPIGLRDLGVPDEVVWQSAGFLPEQIDQMRMLKMAAELTDGIGSDPWPEKAYVEEQHPRNPHGEWAKKPGISAGAEDVKWAGSYDTTIKGPIGGLPPDKPRQRVKDFNALYDNALKNQPVYDAFFDLGQGLQDQHGWDSLESGPNFVNDAKALRAKRGRPVVILAPTKAKKGAADKIKRKKGYTADRLTDLVRGSILVRDLDEIPDAMAKMRTWVESHKGWSIHQPEDLFTADKQNATKKDGYRDLAMLVQTPDGHVTEMQFHVQEMWTAKFNAGHDLYEEIRGLRGIELERPLTSDEESQLDAAVAKSRALYDAEWAKIQARLP